MDVERGIRGVEKNGRGRGGIGVYQLVAYAIQKDFQSMPLVMV